MKQKNQFGGFTLIEILLVVAIIAILAGIVIFAINPAKQLAESRNAQRRSDVNTILNAIYQFSIDHNGAWPTSLDQSSACPGASNGEICNSSTSDCSGLTDLSALTNSQKYLVALPVDPAGSGPSATGYYASINTNNRITVCAPLAEDGVTISVTR